MKKLFALALTVTALTASSSAYAFDDDWDPATRHTVDGMGTTVEGLQTGLSAPIVSFQHLSDGRLDKAIESAIKLPVQGTVTAVAGTLQTISGVGEGIFEGIGNVFETTGKATGNFADCVNKHSAE